MPTASASVSPSVAGALWLLAAFAVVEWWPLTIQYREDTLHLTLSGVVVLVGLFFVGPVPTLAARLVGSGLALRTRWGNPLPKLGVNLGGMALEVWACATIVALVGDAQGLHRPSAWGLLLLASFAGEAAMGATALAGMRISVGPIRREAIGLIATGTLATTSLVTIFTILSVTLIQVAPILVLVVAAAVALPIISNRQRHELAMRHEALRGLHRFITRVDRRADTTTMLGNILDEAAHVVGASTASLFIIDEGRTTRLTNVKGSLAVSWVSQVQVEELIETAPEARIVRPGSAIAALAANLDIELHSVVASLRHAEVEGLLVLTGRPKNLPAVDQRDLDLATAVAHQAGSSLAEARLLDRLREERFRVEEMSRTDVLTGLRNRDGLLRDVPQLRAGTVIVLGIRDHTQISTGLGHTLGERMLVAVADKLRRSAERLEMVVASIGDRFVLIAPGTQDVVDATELARRIEWELSGQFEQGPLVLEIAPVMGVALAPLHGVDTAELVRAADKAMAQAAENGMSVAWFDADYDLRTTQRIQMAGELRRALDNGQISVGYQPQVDLSTGRVIGVEALARWRHPQIGDIAPSEFIDVAERTGLIRPLTLQVVQRALDQLLAWRRAGLDLSMAVNISIGVVQDTVMANHIVSLVRSQDLPPEKITLEITESQLMTDLDRGARVLGIFRAAGLSLSVDDFGTGYSSLSQIKNLPVHELKLDRTFVTDVTRNGTDRAIVTSLVRLAEELDLTVVAEGVEDEATRQTLVDLSCDVGQGYLFSPAVPAAQLPAAVRRIEGAYGAPTRPRLLRRPDEHLG